MDLKRVKIKNIRKIDGEKSFVYDIGVKDKNNPYFIGNNILLHNSCYFTYPTKDEQHNQSLDEVVNFADDIAKQVNSSYSEFTQSNFLVNEFHSKFLKCAREIVASGGIFVTKKRYILHVLDKEGKKVDEPKVMGLDIKKSNLPVYIQEKLTHIVLEYIKGLPWSEIQEQIMTFKNEVRKISQLELGIPKGVKKVEHYTEQFETYGIKARLPGHVAASIFYNLMRKHEQAFSLPAITSGSKIRVFKLKHKIGKFKSIALPRDVEEIPEWFSKYVHIDIDQHIKSLIDNPLNNILHAVGISAPTEHSLFLNTFLEF